MARQSVGARYGVDNGYTQTLFFFDLMYMEIIEIMYMDDDTRDQRWYTRYWYDAPHAIVGNELECKMSVPPELIPWRQHE